MGKGDAFLKKGAGKKATGLGRLKHDLRKDSSLWLDDDGDPFYAEPQMSPAQRGESNLRARTAPAASTAVPASSSPDASQAFLLHSNPEATKKIFIDFDGAVVSNTNWNESSGLATINAEPYDTDGVPGSFSVIERQHIIEVWQRMAEDYSMFSVDVTTQDPGNAALNRSDINDTNYGTHLVMTPTSDWYGPYGGTAYVGTFDEANNGYNQPAWVFTTGLGNDSSNLAEAGSHEVGHNLGLSHDGLSATDTTNAVEYYTGQGAWAPIMGVGYDRPVTQWSKGEYSTASNLEDDFAVMQQHGVTYRPAAHATTLATATAIVAGTPTSDVLRTAADAAYFKIQLPSGSHTITATPAAIGADLDIDLQVLDASGAVLATSNPPVAVISEDTASGLDASITRNYSAGIYYIKIDGSGAGDPSVTGYSDYGSVGQFTLSVASAKSAAATMITGLAGKVVDITGGLNAGSPAQLWPAHGGDNQSFTFNANGSIQARGSNLCLDVKDGRTANGTAVQAWSCNGNGAQQWVQENGRLRNLKSNRCLDVPGSNSASGTRLVIWDCNGGPNQAWTTE